MSNPSCRDTLHQSGVSCISLLFSLVHTADLWWKAWIKVEIKWVNVEAKGGETGRKGLRAELPGLMRETRKTIDWGKETCVCVWERASEIQARSCLLPPHFLELSKQAIKEMAQQEQWEPACVMLSVWKKSCTWIYIHVVYWLSSQYIAFRETLSN